MSDYEKGHSLSGQCRSVVHDVSVGMSDRWKNVTTMIISSILLLKEGGVLLSMSVANAIVNLHRLSTSTPLLEQHQALSPASSAANMQAERHSHHLESLVSKSACSAPLSVSSSAHPRYAMTPWQCTSAMEDAIRVVFKYDTIPRSVVKSKDSLLP